MGRHLSYETPSALRLKLCRKCASALDGDELVRILGLCAACDTRRRRQRTHERRAEKGRRLFMDGPGSDVSVDRAGQADESPLRFDALPISVIRQLARALPREAANALRCCQTAFLKS